MQPKHQGIIFIVGLVIFLHLQANFTLITAAFLAILVIIVYYFAFAEKKYSKEPGAILKASDTGLQRSLELFAQYKAFDIQVYDEVMAGIDYFFGLYAQLLLGNADRQLFDLMWDTRKDIVNNIYSLLFKNSNISGDELDAIVKPVISATMKCLKVLSKKDERLRERLVTLRTASEHMRERTAFDIF